MKNFGLFLGVLLSFASCGMMVDKNSKGSLKEAWNDMNNPYRLNQAYQYQFDKLPTEGELPKKPWSDTYWPSYKGGIASRWNSSEETNAFSYPFLSPTEVRSLSSDKLARLSPAEKYSILVQDYTYSLVQYERQRNHPTDETWFGLCHGWAPASMNFLEPKPINMVSDDGITIPFGSSDIKAILIFVEQYEGTRGPEKSVSDRCNHDLSKNPEYANDPECKDMNPGTFHVILANQIGLLQKGVVADVRRDIQVWNHPIYGFKSEKLGETDVIYPSAALGTKKIITMRTAMNYISEVNPSWNQNSISEYPQQLVSQSYDYNLELNDKGEIIGGEWLQEPRVDFMWQQEAPRFLGYFEKAEELYKLSVMGN